MLAAGRLRDRITIRRLSDEETGRGGFERSWQTIPGMGSVPAELISQSGREAVIGQSLQGIATYRVTIRHRDGIKVNDQILWRGEELNIVSPPADPTGRREMLQFLADTSVRQGA